MDDLDLMPPALPGEERKKPGFFRKFFFKEEPEKERQEQPDELIDIRRKLGLDEEQEMSFQPPPVIREPEGPERFLKDIEPAPKPQEVHIQDWESDEQLPKAAEVSDWTADTVKEEATPSGWASEEAPAHHEAVEQHFEEHGKAAQQVLQKVEQQTKSLTVPDWTIQEKEVHPHQYFILRNGHPVRSLKELIDAVGYISDVTFDHHVTEHRNDFANWIEHVIRNPELAQEVRRAKDRAAIQQVLESHRDQAMKEYEQRHRKLKTLAAKHQQAAKQLQAAEGKLKTIKQRVDQRAKELSDHTQLTSKLIKSSLDTELERRIGEERKALSEERAQLERERSEFEKEAAEHKRRIADLDQLQRTAEERERKATEAEAKAQEQRTQLAQERAEAAPLLAEAAKLRKDFEQAKKARMQTDQNLKEIAKRETELARQEETLRQRERKLTNDLTKLHEQQEKFAALKKEHEEREAKVREREVEARKVAAEATKRMDAALDAERRSTASLKEQTKKLDALRKQIEKSLASVLKNKQKMQSAVQLRKHLEEQILAVKQEVANERKAMEAEAYKSYVESRAQRTPIGQPPSPEADDVLLVKDTGMYHKIEQARAALSRKDLGTAKRLYNELREEFSSMAPDAPERSSLYTSIRELYDDIHLALLEQ